MNLIAFNWTWPESVRVASIHLAQQLGFKQVILQTLLFVFGRVWILVEPNQLDHLHLSQGWLKAFVMLNDLQVQVK